MSTSQEQFNESLAAVVIDAHKTLKEQVFQMSNDIKTLTRQQEEVLSALKGNGFQKGFITQHLECVARVASLEDRVTVMDTAMKLKEASLRGAVWMAGVLGSIIGVAATFLTNYFVHA